MLLIAESFGCTVVAYLSYDCTVSHMTSPRNGPSCLSSLL